MNGFERQILYRPTTKDAKIKNSKKTGQEIFEQYLKADTRLKEEDFSDIYSDEEIKEDKRRVQAMKMSKDYEKPTSHGIVLENLFCDIAEKYQWFGEGSKIVQLTEADDMLVNHTHADAIVEIPIDPSDIDAGVIRIGIDLTTSINNDTLLKKKSKSIDGVRSGKLARVKYFQSKINSERKEINMIPVVVAGIDRETLSEFCSDIAAEDQEKIKNNASQMMILFEIKHQLESMIGLAMHPSVGNEHVAEGLSFYLEMIDYFIETKKSLCSKDFKQRAARDKVYSYITKYF